MFSVHYRFKSQRPDESSAISFDGPYIALGELKARIVAAKNLGSRDSFDLEIVNAQTGEVYSNNPEHFPIPKNTSVVVSRVPLSKVFAPGATSIQVSAASLPKPNLTLGPGFSRAPVAPQSSVQALLMGDDEPSTTTSEADEEARLNALISGGAPPSSDDDEDSKLKALLGIETPNYAYGPNNPFLVGNLGGGMMIFKSRRSHEQNDSTQALPAGSYGRGRGMGRGRGAPLGGVGRGAVPPNYICHRCFQPGHLINHCPTNGDPDFERVRVKKPTGIPRSFLKAVSNTDSGVKPSIMLPGGGFAVVVPNEEVFNKEVLAHRQAAEEQEDVPSEYKCPLCKNLLKDPHITTCCGSSFCATCIKPDMPTSIIVCPMCKKQSTSDKIVPNNALKKLIDKFQRDKETKAKTVVEVEDKAALAAQAAAEAALAEAEAQQAKRLEAASKIKLISLEHKPIVHAPISSTVTQIIIPQELPTRVSTPPALAPASEAASEARTTPPLPSAAVEVKIEPPEGESVALAPPASDSMEVDSSRDSNKPEGVPAGDDSRDGPEKPTETPQPEPEEPEEKPRGLSADSVPRASRPSSKPAPKLSTKLCYICNQTGHVAAACPYANSMPPGYPPPYGMPPGMPPMGYPPYGYPPGGYPPYGMPPGMPPDYYNRPRRRSRSPPRGRRSRSPPRRGYPSPPRRSRSPPRRGRRSRSPPRRSPPRRSPPRHRDRSPPRRRSPSPPRRSPPRHRDRSPERPPRSQTPENDQRRARPEEKTEQVVAAPPRDQRPLDNRPADKMDVDVKRTRPEERDEQAGRDARAKRSDQPSSGENDKKRSRPEDNDELAAEANARAKRPHLEERRPSDRDRPAQPAERPNDRRPTQPDRPFDQRPTQSSDRLVHYGNKPTQQNDRPAAREIYRPGNVRAEPPKEESDPARAAPRDIFFSYGSGGHKTHRG